MSYAFPQHIQELVQEGLATGVYGSEDDMLVAALRLLRDRDQHLQEFREELRVRMERLDRGEGIAVESKDDARRILDDIHTRGMQRLNAARPGK